MKREINAIDLIMAELRRAERKHPGYPADLIHAVGIIAEEVGEAMREAIDIMYGNYRRMPNPSIAKEKALDRYERELAQAAAVCIRALVKVSEVMESERRGVY